MTLKRLNEIDILRFTAAIMVVLFHYNITTYRTQQIHLIDNVFIENILLNGNLGVQLFFIISGFVILMSALNSTPTNFVKSRILRLFPAFVIMCTITFVTCTIFNKNYHVSIRDYLINTTLIGTFASWAGVKLVAGVYWTLIVEMQFYFLIYALLVFKQMKCVRMVLIGWLILSVITYYGELYFNYHNLFNKIRILLITEHSFYFIAGCYFYFIKFNRKRFDIFMPAVILLLAFVCFNTDAKSLLNITSTIIILIFFALFYIISLKDLVFNRNLNFYKGIGNLTYPLYLIHEGIGYLIINWLIFHVNKSLILVICVGGMIAATYIFNIYLEEPITKYFKRYLFKKPSENVSMRDQTLIPDSSANLAK